MGAMEGTFRRRGRRGKRPRFSIVVPTRDRPDLLEFCLEGIARQTFGDVEVVVADNPVQLPAKETYSRFERAGWRYVRAESPLSMHDNFERGCAGATGDYVAVLIDKTILHPNALEVADAVLSAHPKADLLTWWSEGYVPEDEERTVGAGLYTPTRSPTSPQVYDSAAELVKIYSQVERRGIDPIHYFRGKIVFGAYSRALLGRIREHTDRVFYPLSPDYTSRI